MTREQRDSLVLLSCKLEDAISSLGEIDSFHGDAEVEDNLSKRYQSIYDNLTAAYNSTLYICKVTAGKCE